MKYYLLINITSINKMTTLSPKEFKLYIQKMSIKYAVGSNDKEQIQEQIQEQDYEDLKRENESLKKLVIKLTRENTQLYMKYKQQEINELTEKKEKY